MSSVRKILQSKSPLTARIRGGLGALEAGHRGYVDEKLRSEFVDSIEIDEGLREGNDQANRWDYLLGHPGSACVVGLEPHSASTSEISTVIAKKQAAKDQLKPHLASGAKIAAWFWVASGKVALAPFEKAMLRLDQAGITFVGRTLSAKHMKKL